MQNNNTNAIPLVDVAVLRIMLGCLLSSFATISVLTNNVKYFYTLYIGIVRPE